MDCDVVVIGAGLAGLRCAQVLEATGRTVTVLEANPEVGGRIRTEQVDGFTLDRGFQVLNPAYPALHRCVDLAELQLQSFAAGVLVRASDGLRVVADPVRAPQYLTGTLRSGLLSPRDLVGLTRWLAPVLLDAQGSLRQPDTSLHDALDRVGATGNLRRVLDRFLAGVIVDSHGTTSANFTRLLVRMFVLGAPGLPTGGMNRLPKQLARQVTDVRLNTPARALDLQRPHVETDGGRIVARTLVVATDARTATQLTGIPERPTKGLVTWWYAVDGAAPVPDPLLVVDGRGDDKPPGPVWNAAVVSNAAPSYAPAGRHLVEATTLLDRPDGDAPDQEVRRHLGDIYGCETASWRTLARHRIPDALPACPLPLQLTSPTEVSATVFVCGDHRDTASIQGALVSGERVASAVLDRLRAP